MFRPFTNQETVFLNYIKYLNFKHVYSRPAYIVDHEHHDEGHYKVKGGLNALPSQKHIKVLD